MKQRATRLTIFLLVGLSIGISFIPQPGNAELPTPPITLPAPRECADPIEGTWVSVVNYPLRTEWYLFQLTVRRRAESPEGAYRWADGHTPQRTPRVVTAYQYGQANSLGTTLRRRQHLQGDRLPESVAQEPWQSARHPLHQGPQHE